MKMTRRLSPVEKAELDHLQADFSSAQTSWTELYQSDSWRTDDASLHRLCEYEATIRRMAARISELRTVKSPSALPLSATLPNEWPREF
jgi:hypothetical protein